MRLHILYIHMYMRVVHEMRDDTFISGFGGSSFFGVNNRDVSDWYYCRVEEHPPGEKALEDFQDVFNYGYSRRRRRTNGNEEEHSDKNDKQKKKEHKKRKTSSKRKAAKCDEQQNAKESEKDHKASEPEDKENTQEAVSATAEEKKTDESSKENRNTLNTVEETTIDCSNFKTPATKIAKVTSPDSRNSNKSSSYVMALTDAHFQPTPFVTPTGDLLAKESSSLEPKKETRGSGDAVNKQRPNPQPKTIFSKLRCSQAPIAINLSSMKDVAKFNSNKFVTGDNLETEDRKAQNETEQTRETEQPPELVQSEKSDKVILPSISKLADKNLEIRERKDENCQQSQSDRANRNGTRLPEPFLNIYRFGCGPVLKRPLSVPPLFKPLDNQKISQKPRITYPSGNNIASPFFFKEKQILAAVRDNANKLSLSSSIKNGPSIKNCSLHCQTEKKNPENAMGALLGVAMQRLQKMG